jgi:hypothetical protein
MKSISVSYSRTGRVLRQLAVALLAVTGTAMGQTAAPVGVAKPAEYDCSGLAGVALTSCRQLNAGAVKGAMARSDGTSNSTHDCDGMSGAALATCRDLNGQSPAPGADASGAVGNGYGSAAMGMGYPGGSTGSQTTPGNSITSSQGVTTPIPEQTTGGTNPITPSGTGATAMTGGTNPISPSGTGATATTGGTNPISLSGNGATATTGGTNPIAPSGTGIPR